MARLRLRPTDVSRDSDDRHVMDGWIVGVLSVGVLTVMPFVGSNTVAEIDLDRPEAMTTV